MRMSVVFPAPFGPRKPKILPARTRRLTSVNALTSPKRRVIPTVSNRGITPVKTDKRVRYYRGFFKTGPGATKGGDPCGVITAGLTNAVGSIAALKIVLTLAIKVCPSNGLGRNGRFSF